MMDLLKVQKWVIFHDRTMAFDKNNGINVGINVCKKNSSDISIVHIQI